MKRFTVSEFNYLFYLIGNVTTGQIWEILKIFIVQVLQFTATSLLVQYLCELHFWSIWPSLYRDQLPLWFLRDWLGKSHFKHTGIEFG